MPDSLLSTLDPLSRKSIILKLVQIIKKAKRKGVYIEKFK